MRILILGAGFAGVATARALERRLRPEEAEIAIVGRDNFSLFTPMLPEVSAGGLETRHVVTPVRAELRRARFVLGDVTAGPPDQDRGAARARMPDGDLPAVPAVVLSGDGLILVPVGDMQQAGDSQPVVF